MVQAFSELLGELSPGHQRQPPDGSFVVYSDLVRGATQGGSLPGPILKYVADGTVHHRFGQRTYSVRAGEWLFVPPGHSSEMEVRGGDGGSSVGLCVFFYEPGQVAANPIERPVVFQAQCSALGRLLDAEIGGFRHGGPGRTQRAQSLIDTAHRHLEVLLEDAAAQLDALQAVKSSTRYELLRRLERARGHLHAVEDRRVTLDELAAVAGLSRFHLLRHFRACYGAAPGAYHRKLRVDLARAAVDRRRLSLRDAAHRYGFADASTLAKARRRTLAG